MNRKTLHTSNDMLPWSMPARFFYRLDADGNPVPCDDAASQRAWLSELDRSVAFDRVGAVRVTTVFVGLSVQDNPRPWETAVCTEESVTVVKDYASLQEAIQGHDRIVEEVVDRHAGTDSPGKGGTA